MIRIETRSSADPLTCGLGHLISPSPSMSTDYGSRNGTPGFSLLAFFFSFFFFWHFARYTKWLPDRLGLHFEKPRLYYVVRVVRMPPVTLVAEHPLAKSYGLFRWDSAG